MNRKSARISRVIPQRSIRVWFAARRFVVPLGLIVLAAMNSVALGDTWFYLSNDGDPTLLMKTPSYYSVPDKSQHLGIVPFKTEVEVLESRKDAALSILVWKKVRILSGQFRGRTGWVSGNCVIKTDEPRPAAKIGDGAGRAKRLNRSLPGKEDRVTGLISTATQLRDRPNVLDSAIDAPRLTPDTALVRLSDESRRENVGMDFEWIEVEVVDGPHRGKKGWVLRHHVREFRRLLYFAIWYKVGDRAFERAANTALKEFEAKLKTPAGHSASPIDVEYEGMSLGVRTKSEFLAAWSQVKARADKAHLEVYYGAILTHASIQNDLRDGLEFSSEESDSTLRPGEIAGLPKLPWASDAHGLVLHGCYTGAYTTKYDGLVSRRNWCPAEILAKKQRVTTWGEDGTSTFSTDPNKYVEIKETDQQIYLHAYNRGKNNLFGDGGRILARKFPSTAAE